MNLDWNSLSLKTITEIHNETGLPKSTIRRRLKALGLEAKVYVPPRQADATCPVCQAAHRNPKFCSSSCAATHNNKGDHKNPPKIRTCSWCLDEFSKSGSHKSNSLCESCYEAYQTHGATAKSINDSDIIANSSYQNTLSWRNRTKNNLVLAAGRKCRLCSYSKCAKALEFHHLNGEDKLFSLSSRIRSVAVIIAEAKKCVLLCANCHREVHDGISSLNGIEPIFDEKIFHLSKEIAMSPCPYCKVMKLSNNKYCSKICAAKQNRKVDWDNLDLEDLLFRNKGNMSAVSKELDISEIAIKRMLVRLGKDDLLSAARAAAAD